MGSFSETIQNRRGYEARAERHPCSRSRTRASQDFLSIVTMDLSNDMSHCRVFVSSM
jgi:hypothetical protein